MRLMLSRSLLQSLRKDDVALKVKASKRIDLILLLRDDDDVILEVVNAFLPRIDLIQLLLLRREVVVALRMGL